MPRKYRKTVKVILETEAQNRNEAQGFLNDVAHSIHSLGHPLTTGGNGNRVVSMSHKSTGVTFVKKGK